MKRRGARECDPAAEHAHKAEAITMQSRCPLWVGTAGICILRVCRQCAPSAIALLVIASPLRASAADGRLSGDAQRPARSIAILSDYSGVVVPVGEKVRLDLTVENRGRQDETVALRVAPVPTGWRATVRGGEFTVTGVAVPAGKTRNLVFDAEPAKGIRPGTYLFGIDGETRDRQLTAHYAITITTREPSRTGAPDLRVTTSYPVLRGQTDSTFDFSLDIANKSDADRAVDLTAQLPTGWQVNFKPGYESKLISSVAIRAQSSQTVTASISPAADAPAGDYPVLVRATAGESRAELPLHVLLSGTFKLDVTTPSGLLSTDAVVGEPVKIAVVVKNTGSAPNQAIRLTAFKPENWKVDFTPDQLASLAPGASQTVQAAITPAATALVGDYSITLGADGEKGSSKSLDFRVAVAPSPGWAWIGVGLIVLSIGGMGGLFVWLGRR